MKFELNHLINGIFSIIIVSGEHVINWQGNPFSLYDRLMLLKKQSSTRKDKLLLLCVDTALDLLDGLVDRK